MKTDSKPLISVIIPVYNCAPYLNKCISSILCNTYRDLEVLCVDDGSTDESLEILRGFAAQDSRVRVFHQENTGVSAARNVALEAASGAYISFIDSDDWIHLRYYETLLRYMDEDCDIVTCEFMNCYGLVEDSQIADVEVQTYTQEEALEVRNIFTYTVARLYREKIFRSLRFSQEMTHSEDLYINQQILLRCNLVKRISAVLYYRLVRSDSLSHFRGAKEEIPIMQAFLTLAKQSGPFQSIFVRRAYRFFLSGRQKNKIEPGAQGYEEMTQMIEELKTLGELLPRRERTRYLFFLNRPRLFNLLYTIRQAYVHARRRIRER